MDAGTVGAVVGWVAGVGSTAISLTVKHWLDVARDKRRLLVSEQERRRNTDRATCENRCTRLILCNLAAYIHSGRWRKDDAGLEQLLARLGAGGYASFLDPEVEREWVGLVETTVALGQRRLQSGNRPISSEDLQAFMEIRRSWERAAKTSFGPLPDLGQPDESRTRQECAEELLEAA